MVKWQLRFLLPVLLVFLALAGANADWVRPAEAQSDPPLLEDLLVLRGHTDNVWTVSWSPDGSQLATGGPEGVLIIWDTASGNRVKAFTDASGGVWAAVWSPDGTRLAILDSETVTIRDAESDEVQGTYQHPEIDDLRGFENDSLAWSPDGTLLALFYRTEVAILDGENGELLHLYVNDQPTQGQTLEGVWSPDSSRLAMLNANDRDTTVVIWDATTGETLHTLGGHIQPVTGVAWSPDGTQVASSSEDVTLMVWDAEEGTAQQTLSGHTEALSGAAWSPDGAFLASSSDSEILIWDTAAWEAVQTITVLRFRGAMSNTVSSIAWSPAGPHLATYSQQGLVYVYSTETGNAVGLAGNTSGGVWQQSYAWAPDGSRLATGGGRMTGNSEVHIWGLPE